MNRNYLTYRKNKYQTLHKNKNKNNLKSHKTTTRLIKNDNNAAMNDNNILEDRCSITETSVPQHNPNTVGMLKKIDLAKDDKKLYKNCVNEIVNEYSIALMERRNGGCKGLWKNVLNDLIHKKWYDYGLIDKNVIPVPAKTIRNRHCLLAIKDTNVCIDNNEYHKPPTIEDIDEGRDS